MAFTESLVTVVGQPFIVPAYAKQMILAVCLGLVMGAERGLRKKMASYRTFAVIASGSCLFTLLSVSAVGDNTNFDITRIAAQIVTGIGFVGGGVIFKTSNHVEGITTAAMIWLAAAIGMACGFNEIGMAFVGLLTFLFVEIIGIGTRRAQDYTTAKLRLGKGNSESAKEG